MISRKPLSVSMPQTPPPKSKTPSIGLALGGGGARGLAHVLMFEAFDELGIKPSVISGTSIGAIFGAAYASGLSAKEIRAHMDELLTLRFGLIRDVYAARAQSVQRFLLPFARSSALLKPEALLDIAMPKATKRTFEELPIPLRIVASDFYDQEQMVFSKGPLFPAIAASMALPAVFEPVSFEGRAMVDGGLTNPLPFDILETEADIVVAIDVSGAPVPNPDRALPTAFEALFASAFLFERSIIREKLKAATPDILISAGTSRFQVLDLLRHKEILAAAGPAKDRLKAQLERVLSVETLPIIEAARNAPLSIIDQAGPEKPAKRSRRGLLKRKRRDDGGE
jgi:NTE family protein